MSYLSGDFFIEYERTPRRGMNEKMLYDILVDPKNEDNYLMENTTTRVVFFWERPDGLFQKVSMNPAAIVALAEEIKKINREKVPSVPKEDYFPM